MRLKHREKNYMHGQSCLSISVSSCKDIMMNNFTCVRSSVPFLQYNFWLMSSSIIIITTSMNWVFVRRVRWHSAVRMVYFFTVFLFLYFLWDNYNIVISYHDILPGITFNETWSHLNIEYIVPLSLISTVKL